MKTIKTVVTFSIISLFILLNINLSVKAQTPEELYKIAYKSVLNVKSSQTQKSINEARVSIRNLKGTTAAWAVGEFSKQVDKVQHPLLIKTISAINKAKISLKQADIDEAKASIDPDYPLLWKNPYSEAVDIIQQKLYDKARELVNVALNTKMQSDIDEAKNIIAELKTTPNYTAKKSLMLFIYILETKLNGLTTKPY